MANPEHVELLWQGADAISDWREANPDAPLELRGANLHRADLVGAGLCEAHLAGADLRDADLNAADLDGADLQRANLHGANLSGANLSGAYLHEADLSRANLSRADLHSAQLNEARLRGANLTWANLMWADLVGADLEGTQLRGANLFESLLWGARLRAADLSHAKLHAACLSEADLRGANLTGAHLDEANLHGTQFGWTVFGDVDLSAVKDLSTARHQGPSTIGVDTLARSRGRIPGEFLRQCGFRPWQILEAKLYDPALSLDDLREFHQQAVLARQRSPLTLGGVFISHAHADAAFADQLRRRLGEDDIPTWQDRRGVSDEALPRPNVPRVRRNDLVLLVLSAASVVSDWIAQELDRIRHKEKEEGREILRLLALDDAWRARVADVEADPRAVWQYVGQKPILDFTGWDRGGGREAFAVLASGLRI